MQEDAVEVITRLFGRDRKPGAVDQLGQYTRRKFEAGRQIPFNDDGEVVARQSGQLEPAPSGFDSHAVVGGLQTDLTTVGQLARDVEQEMRRDRDGPRRFY